MSDINANFAIRQFTVLPLTPPTPSATTPAASPGGTPIVCPIGCSQIVLENTDTVNSIQVYTDPATSLSIAATTKNIPPGLELTLRASILAWAAGAVVCFVSSPNSGGVCTVTFLR